MALEVNLWPEQGQIVPPGYYGIDDDRAGHH